MPQYFVTEKQQTWLGCLSAALFWGVVLFVPVSCQEYMEAQYRPKEATVRRVSRVFMHEPNNYTLWSVTDGAVSEVTVSASTVRIVLDGGDDPWAWFSYTAWRDDVWPKAKYYGHADKLVLHLSSVRSVEGGGWDHGKFGRGATTVVQ
ncbi:MAG: hypothetical protein JSS66_06150 [Armatimonadetes bacterium]|nr:hypothetical protein [Armatimonadota bacterium]